MTRECDDPSCACHQLAWMEYMDKIAQEELGAQPRGDVIVPNVYAEEDDDLTP